MVKSCNKVVSGKEKKKKVKKKRGCPKIFRHPLLGLILLIEGILAFIAHSFIPKSAFLFGDYTCPSEVTKINDELICVVDDVAAYFFNSSDGSLDHIICAGESEPDAYPYLSDITPGEGDHVFAHVSVTGATRVVEREYIILLLIYAPLPTPLSGC